MWLLLNLQPSIQTMFYNEQGLHQMEKIAKFEDAIRACYGSL